MKQPNRIEIKAKARKMIKGKLYEIWKPLLVISLVILIVSTTS